MPLVGYRLVLVDAGDKCVVSLVRKGPVVSAIMRPIRTMVSNDVRFGGIAGADSRRTDKKGVMVLSMRDLATGVISK